MTARAALAQALLNGHVLTVKNCFELIGLTNIAREIPRMIEHPFNVRVSRVTKTGKSRYGQAVSYVEYRLNRAEHNKEGIEKMKAYVREQLPSPSEVKTDEQERMLKRAQLALTF
jgi:hypothetical protein